MKCYIKATSTSGLIGIWWIYKDQIVADALPVESGYSDGNYIQYHEIKNHSTEWRRLVKQYLPQQCDEIIPKGYKSLERGRVIYNLRTQCYEVTCSNNVFQSLELRDLIVDAFKLTGCRYDFVALNHYHVAELTGNPELDRFEYN